MAALSTTFQARDPTSDTQSSGRPRTRYRYRVPFRFRPCGPRRASGLVKDLVAAEPGCLPSTSAPSPDRAPPDPTLSRRTMLCTWDHEEPLTVSLGTYWQLSLPRPASGASSPAARPAFRRTASGLDPLAFRPGPCAARRLLQSLRSASTTTGSFEPRRVRGARPAGACALRVLLPFDNALALSVRRRGPSRSRIPSDEPHLARAAPSATASYEAETSIRANAVVTGRDFTG